MAISACTEVGSAARVVIGTVAITTRASTTTNQKRTMRRSLCFSHSVSSTFDWKLRLGRLALIMYSGCSLNALTIRSYGDLLFRCVSQHILNRPKAQSMADIQGNSSSRVVETECCVFTDGRT